MKKRLLALALAAVLCVTALPAQAANVGLSGERAEVPVTDSSHPSAPAERVVPAVPAREASARLSASTPVNSGSCGSSVNWAFYDDGLLHLTGSGAMATYNVPAGVPWNSYRSQITRVQIDEGVTAITKHAFVYCPALTEVSIPNSVSSLGLRSFADCTALTAIAIPSGVTKVDDNAFVGCTALERVSISDLDAWFAISFSNAGANPLTQAHTLYLNDEPVTDLVIPEGVTAIKPYTFSGWSEPATVTIGSTLEAVGKGAFDGCAGITDVFYSQPDQTGLIIDPTGNAGLTGAYWHYNFTGGLLVKLVVAPSDQGTLQMPRYACPGETVSITPAPGPGYRFQSVTADQGTVTDDLHYTVPQDETLEAVTFTPSFEPLYPDRVVAAGGQCGDSLTGGHLTWVLYTDGFMLISGDGRMADYERADAAPWHEDRGQITSVLVEEGVSSVGAYAFAQCPGLASVTIPASVTAIGARAFDVCANITDVFYSQPDQAGLSVAPTGNTALTDAYWHYGFNGGPLVELTVAPSDQGTLRIPRCAYLGETVSITPLPGPGYRFKSVTADQGTVTDDLHYTVPLDETLETVTFTPVFEPIDPDRIVAAGGQCGDELNWILYTDGLMLISGNGLMADWKSAGAVPWHGYRSQIITVLIEDGVSSVGGFAFTQCPNLTSVTIPASVTSIGASAFAECDNLGRAEFLGGVPSLGANTFYKNRDLPFAGQFCIYYHEGKGWEELASSSSDGKWNGYYIDCVEAAASVTDFSTLDANNRNSQGVLFLLNSDPDTGSFSARVGNNTTAENNSGYYGMCDGVVTIPDTVTAVDGKEYKVRNVGQNAFAGNKTVREIILGENVQGLEPSSFQDTSNLALVTPVETNEKYTSVDGVLYHYDKTILYVYPAKKEDLSFTVPETVETVISNAFRSNPFLKEVTVPGNVTGIGPEAFYNCRSLSKLTLPFLGNFQEDSVPFAQVFSKDNLASAVPATLKEVVITGEELCEGAFDGCSNIQRITLPSCSTVPKSSFRNCSGLISLRFADSELEYTDGVLLLPEGVSSIGDSAFNKCTSLTDATFAQGLESIGAQAFRGCSRLARVTMPLGLQTIGSSAFYECGALETASIPNSVTEVGASAFYKCRSLPSIVIPDSVTTVGDQAFSGCSSAKRVTIGYGLAALGGKRVFYACPEIQSFSVDKGNAHFTSDRWGVLFNKNKSILLNYPAGRSLPYYSVPGATDTVQSYAFQHHDDLQNLYIPNRVGLQKDAIEGGTGTTYCVYSGSNAANDLLTAGLTPWDMNRVKPQAIQIEGLPDCAALPLGSDELEGLYLLVTYDNGLVLQMEDYAISYGAPEPSGYQLATVSYQDLTATFEVLRYDPQQHAPMYCGPLDPELADAVKFAALYQDGKLRSTYTPLVINGKLLIRADKDHAQLTGKLFQLDGKTLAPLAEIVQLPVPTIY